MKNILESQSSDKSILSRFMNLFRCLFFLIILSPAILFSAIHYIRPKKTGSTTVINLLRNQLGDERFYQVGGENLITASDWDEAVEKISRLPPIGSKDIIVGHYPIWFFKLNDCDPDAFYFVTLRNPVKRTLSQFQHLRDKGFPIESPIDIQMNHMCHVLSSDPTLEGSALLEDAIANLDKMDHVIFLEDFEYGVRELFRKLGLDPTCEIPRKNSSKKRTFSLKVLRQVEKNNSLDIALYDYAINKYGR